MGGQENVENVAQPKNENNLPVRNLKKSSDKRKLKFEKMMTRETSKESLDATAGTKGNRPPVEIKDREVYKFYEKSSPDNSEDKEGESELQGLMERIRYLEQKLSENTQ